MKRIHFIGIGGIGMSGLARIYLDKGCIISGSDLGENRLTDLLRAKGAVISRGHARSNIPEGADLVIKSSCIRDNNPEVQRARELGIPVILRGEMLKRTLDIFNNSFAVTGTHGKTTTTALISHILEKKSKDPTVLVGGEVSTFGGNAKTGSGDFFVAEVDESDGYFRNLSSKYVVITNIEREHMEHYGSMRRVKDSYGRFIDNIYDGGILAVNGEDFNIKDILCHRDVDFVTFGMNGRYDFSCRDHSGDGKIDFELLINDEPSGRITSGLIGSYNIMNILGAIALLHGAGFDIDDEVRRSITSFPGVKRRFEKIGMIKNVQVFEDYAHHPTEIKSVIKAAAAYAPGRVITIFQPHRYSRTLDLIEDFRESFCDTDVLVITDIYSAHEDRVDGISVRTLFGEIGPKKKESVEFLSKDMIPQFVSGIATPGDIILILGAGDIRDIGPAVIKHIEQADALR